MGSRGPQIRDFEFHCVPLVWINREIKEMAVLGRGFGMLMVAHVGVGGSKMDQNMLT